MRPKTLVVLTSAVLAGIARAQDFALSGAGAMDQTRAPEIVSYDSKSPSWGNIRLKLQREDNSAELNATLHNSQQ